MRLLYFVISSGSLIGLVLLIRKMFRKQIAPGILYALWLIPLIRLAIPFGFFEMPVFGTAAQLLSAPYAAVSEAGNLFSHLTEEESERSYAEEPDVPGTEEAAEAEASRLLTDQSEEDFAEKEGTQSASERIPRTVGLQPEGTTGLQEQDSGIRQVWNAIWLCGSILLGFYAVLSNRRLKKGIRHMEEMHADCPIPVCVSDAVVSPCLFGLFRPCILVNRTVTENPALYHYVLKHELTHYRQKDHIWTFLRILLCVIYWWNPLVWIGASCAKEDAELSCDAKVIRGLPAADRKAYGYSLLLLLKNAQGGSRGMCIATSMSGSKRGLKRRMEGIAEGAETKKTVFLPVFLLLITAMLYGCGIPSAKSWIKGEPEGSIEQEASMDYETSLQNEIQSRLFYYEIYQYGELTERKVLAYGKLEGESRRGFGANLTFMPAKPEGTETLTLRIDEMETIIDLPIYNTEEKDMMTGRSVLCHDGKKREIKAGDDLILMADYYQYITEEQDAISYVSCEDLMTEPEEKEEMLSNIFQTVLIRMVLSDQSEEQLYQQYSRMEYPTEGTPSDTVSDSAESFVRFWADAFVARDGSALQEMMAENAWKKMAEEGGLVIEEDDDIFFGWSSPWPMSPDDNYRILNCDGQTAEILYYAWVSDPHMYVWRETLQIRQEEDIWQVTGENLLLLDYITSAEEFYKAYPDGRITGTMMDYETNGMGEALNQNALKNRENAFYYRLFDPEGAACYLLNISGLSYGVITDESEWATTSSEIKDGIADVQITFKKDGTTVEVSMIQPYGDDGIWIPQTKTDLSDPENAELPDSNGESPESGESGRTHRDGFEDASLTYVLPDSLKDQYQDQGYHMGQMEGYAQRALQDLYDLTGTKVDQCVYMSVNDGSFYFAKTAEDMNRGRVFYSRTFQEEENMIPSMDIAYAGKAGYSDVQQLTVPSDIDYMDDKELAVWFLQHSPLYQGETVAYAEPVSEEQQDLIKTVMEDGAFYEIQIDREVQAVTHISGPYPKGFA